MLTVDYLKSSLYSLREFVSTDTQILQGNGYDGIIDILEHLRSVSFPAVILEAGSSGTVQFVEGPVNTFTQSLWVMGQLGRGEDEAALYLSMLNLARKIVARLVLDIDKAPEVQGLDFQRFTYLQRWGGQNARGYEIILTFRKDFSLVLTPEDFKPFRLLEYFYRQDYSSLDYEAAKRYFLGHNPQISPAACTAVSQGDFTGRNHDWYYGRRVEFFLKTARTKNNLASIGVAGDINALTKDVMEHDQRQDIYNLIPFFTLDGLNEKHVFCCTNVVPLDKGTTTETIPAIEEKDRICSVMVVRYVLDHFSTAQQAVEYLRDYVAIYPAKSLQDQGYETHWMIRDLQHCYIVEMIDNRIVVNEYPVMANFFVDGVTFNPDGKVWTPEDVADGHLPSDNGITPLGSGLERHNYAIDHLSGVTSMAKMRELMTGLLYTKTYLSAPVVADPIWHTEYVGRLTVDDPAEEYADVEQRYAEKFSQRDRDIPEDQIRTWLTTHSSVYDVANLKLTVISQEDLEHELTFEL